MTTAATGTAVLVGSLVHLVLSIAYGIVFAAFFAILAPETRKSFGGEAAIGAFYGTLLYLVNLQIIARLAFPWFLEANQLLQWVLHAVTYGLPLGLAFAASERRAAPIFRVPMQR
jgi:hypothetical protein